MFRDFHRYVIVSHPSRILCSPNDHMIENSSLQIFRSTSHQILLKLFSSPQWVCTFLLLSIKNVKLIGTSTSSTSLASYSYLPLRIIPVHYIHQDACPFLHPHSSNTLDPSQAACTTLVAACYTANYTWGATIGVTPEIYIIGAIAPLSLVIQVVPFLWSFLLCKGQLSTDHHLRRRRPGGDWWYVQSS